MSAGLKEAFLDPDLLPCPCAKQDISGLGDPGAGQACLEQLLVPDEVPPASGTGRCGPFVIITDMPATAVAFKDLGAANGFDWVANGLMGRQSRLRRTSTDVRRSMSRMSASRCTRVATPGVSRPMQSLHEYLE